MNKCDIRSLCSYCTQSKLEYATLYCNNRINERISLLNNIYKMILPEFGVWFTSNSRHQKGISAKCMDNK